MRQNVTKRLKARQKCVDDENAISKNLPLLIAQDTQQCTEHPTQIRGCVLVPRTQKAFDTVNHPILLSKLYSFGVKGNAYELLSSYLDNRTQRCAVNDPISKSCTLTCGIPQGTILGPLLFHLYINDLPNCLSNSQPRMYADDTHLTYANNDICAIEASLNQDLLNINRWLIANKLTLNMTKTEFMLIGSRQKLNSLCSSCFGN